MVKNRTIAVEKVPPAGIKGAWEMMEEKILGERTEVSGVRGVISGMT